MVEAKYKPMKERVDYVTIENGTIVGRPVNIDILIPAKDHEDLKRKTRAMVQSWINLYNELLSTDEPFEFIESTEDIVFPKSHVK